MYLFHVLCLLTVEEVTLTAIRCLAYFFMVKNRKKDDAKTEMDVPFILNEGMVC